MPLVPKWQDYRKFYVNCILEIHVILKSQQGSKKPGSVGAGLPRNEDISHELSSWLQKILEEKKYLIEN